LTKIKNWAGWSDQSSNTIIRYLLNECHELEDYWADMMSPLRNNTKSITFLGETTNSTVLDRFNNLESNLSSASQQIMRCNIDFRKEMYVQRSQIIKKCKKNNF
jgi:hypothetical protein